MRRLAVSDIHGEGRRLELVLAKAEYDPSTDKLFLLGDYIDRVEDPKNTVELVRRLVEGGAVALKGNHDAMPGEVVCGRGSLEFWLFRNGGNRTLDSFNGFPPVDVINWLDNLPLFHEEPDCILVHAGVSPEPIPLEEQNPHNFLWIRGEFYNNYRGKRVIFGHTPTPHLHERNAPETDKWKPWIQGDMVGIDTGAAYGGPLTLIDIDTLQTWTA